MRRQQARHYYYSMDYSNNFLTAKNKYGHYCVPKSSAYTLTSGAILAGRIHEPTTIKFIIENSHGKDVIHAGAGFGDFLPALSRNCSGNIFAFEPNHENFLCAQKTIEINKLANVTLENCGLGSSRASKFVKTKEDGLSLGPRTLTVDAADQHAEYQGVEIFPLDDVVKSRRVSIIHLDTEGYEFEILRGAKDIIETCAPLIILEIDGIALNYNKFMLQLGYVPLKQLIYDAKEMVFVNTVYAKQHGR